MASTIWKGSIGFGVMMIPVTMHSAVRARNGGISFHQLHAKDKSRIRHRKVCEREGKEVPPAEIVKGYEYEKGKHIVLSEEDLEQAERATSRAFEIAAFVPEDEVDKRYFDQPYYLAPLPGGEKAYALLRDALAETGSIGVGSFVLRKKTHLAGLTVVEDAMMLELMRYERELVDVEEVRIPEVKDVRPQERQMAEQLIENLSEEFDPSKFRDEYTLTLRKIIDAKLKGKKLKLDTADEEEDSGVVDIMARLQESLEKTGKSAKKSTARKAPAKKAPAKSAGTDKKRKSA